MLIDSGLVRFVLVDSNLVGSEPSQATPDLQRVSFYSVIDFLYHSFTTKLLLP
jgi:hypothetical protein